jgi:hypothetical protein
VNSTETPDIGPANAAYKMMESNVDAKTAIEEVIALATHEIRIFDVSPSALQDRDFGRPARIDALKAVLQKNRQNRIRIVLHETSGIESTLPRLINLAGTYSTQFKIVRAIGAAREAKDVLLIADDAQVWRKPYFEHPKSIQTLHDPVSAKPFIERFEEIWENIEIVPIGSATGL